MNVDTINETLCINQIIGQKTDNVIIEEDFVVPDIKPDILNVINTSGTVCIYKKEIMDGKIKIDGSINTYIIYLAESEDNQVRSMNINLDFSHTIDVDNLKSGMMIDIDVKIKQIESRVLNGRKVNVKAILDLNIIAYSNEKLEFMNEINNVDNIQLLRKEININSLLGTGNTKVYAKDTVVIDNIDELAEIMKVNIDIRNQETKISYNKVLIKADSCIKIMYLTTDNRICTKSSVIPIMGFIDMQDISDDNICDVKYEIKNMLIKPNSNEEHSIYIEIEIEATCSSYVNKSLSLIQDLYSPTVNLTYKQNIVKTMAQKNCIKDIYPIREKQIIEEIHNNKIYDVDVKTNILNQNILDDRIIFDGEVELNFIYGIESNNINTKTIAIPFNYNMNCPGINLNSKISPNIEILNADFVVMPDESIDIKIDLGFIVNSYRNEDINMIEEINVEENREDERYSIIIYFTKTGDTLWQIAKRFKSTVDVIASLNGIEDKNKIEVGEKLFIPMAI